MHSRRYPLPRMHLFKRRASIRRSKKCRGSGRIVYRGFTLPLYRKKKSAKNKEDEHADGGAGSTAPAAPSEGAAPPVRPERRKKKAKQSETLWPLPTQVHAEYPSTMLKVYRDEYKRALLGLCRPATAQRPLPPTAQAIFYAPTPVSGEHPRPPRPASPASSSSTSSSPTSTPSAREQFLMAARSRPRAHRRWSTTESVLKFHGVPRPTLIRRARSGQGRGPAVTRRSPSPSTSNACSCTCSCCSCCSRCPCEPEDEIQPLVWPVSRIMALQAAAAAAGRQDSPLLPPVGRVCRKDPALRQRAPPAQLLEGSPLPTRELTTKKEPTKEAPTPAPRLSLVGLAPVVDECPPPPPDYCTPPPQPTQVVMRRAPRDRPVPMKRYSLIEIKSSDSSPQGGLPLPLKRHSLHDPAVTARDIALQAPAGLVVMPAESSRHSMVELESAREDDKLSTSSAEPERRPRVLPLITINKYSTISRIRVPISTTPCQPDKDRRANTMGRRRPQQRRERLESYDLETRRPALPLPRAPPSRVPPPVPPASAKPRLASLASLQPSLAVPLARTVLRIAQQGGSPVPAPVRPHPRVAAVEPQRRMTTAIGINMVPGESPTTRITEVQPARLAAKPPPCPARPSSLVALGGKDTECESCDGKPGGQRCPALPPRPPKEGLGRGRSRSVDREMERPRPRPDSRPDSRLDSRSAKEADVNYCADTGTPCTLFGRRMRC